MFKLPISKYKNGGAKIVKKEQILSGVSTNRLSNTIGSLINSSLNYITFANDCSSGGSICTIPHEALSQRATFSNDSFCVTHAHNGPITDIQYNPYNQSLLATSGFDSQIQLWNVNESGLSTTLSPTTTLQLNENRCDCVQWNPNVENVLISTSLSTVYLWNVQNPQSCVLTYRGHNEAIQSISWKRDGSLLVSTSKDKTMQIFDPRNGRQNENLRVENSKTSNKDSKAVWLGSSDFILSSVYTQSFQREVQLWDVRNLSDPVHVSQIDTGNNVLNPLYDHDTSILFLVGKAETMIRYCEVFLNEATNFVCDSVQPVDDQIKAICMVPKFGLDLMKCEVDRLLLLTRSSIYPLPYYIPRRSYFDFYSEIYPETQDIKTPGIDANAWLSGANSSLPKISLNPDTQSRILGKPSANGVVSTDEVKVAASMPTKAKEPTPSPAQTKAESMVPKPTLSNDLNIDKNVTPSSYANGKSTLSNGNHNGTDSIHKPTNGVSEKNSENKTVPNNGTSAVETPVVTFRSQNADRSVQSVQQRAKTTKSVYYQSKYKYIDGKSAHKSEHITNIRNLSTMWSSECNGFQINSKHAAFLLSSTSGQIGVVELNKPGRLPDTNIYSIINKSKVSDFQWDPYDDETIAAACDDGVIRIWNVPEDGLCESLENPSAELRGHIEKLYCIKYHPYAKSVLASASYDRSIKIWNVDTNQEQISLKGHVDVIFSICWSQCGNKLASISKDGSIRIYEPLISDIPVLEVKCGPGSGSKAARIEWVLNDTCILVSGFGKGNLRQVYLFDSKDLTLLHTEDINQSPSLLIPYFDQDINVLYLYAKGEETLYLYEILSNEPYFQVLSPFKPEGLHFAMGFLPKINCDIRAAEIGKAFRLTKDSRIEKVSFTVPRVKLSYFQDDIFPDTVDKKTPYLSANDWFNRKPIQLRYINLQPADLQKLSEITALEQAQSKPTKKSSFADEKKGGIYDEQFNQAEKLIISSMLNRTTFFKDKSDDEDDSDWQ